MISFKSFIREKEEELPKEGNGATVDISSFLDKINNCKTEAGLNELEKYYNQRKKEINIKPADDITIRDAIEGRREEIEAMYAEDEVEEAVEEV